MGEKHTAPVSRECLCFMLYQMRDDLAELLYRLESGAMPCEQVIAGAKAELEQMLRALENEAETGKIIRLL
jgi:exonuclease VII small subunit